MSSLHEQMGIDDVVRAFEAVLRIHDVKSEDNFFDLGGSSLLAIELIALVRERTGWQVSLLDLIRHPTPASMLGFIHDRHE